MSIHELRELAQKCGFTYTGIIAVAELVFDETVRDMCAGCGCGQYGRSWACPPAVGTLAECQERCESYGQMLLLAAQVPVTSWDRQGFAVAIEAFKKLIRRFDQELSGRLPRYQLLGNEGCGGCKECSYPKPCRAPERCYHALEGYGFKVSQLAEQAGIPYKGEGNTVIFFGALLFE
ncbi:MAG: DUF2284 domain-containing protein [Clostridia bacterium]|nr:DUF2284 domain-containing protein [Clostridia bacterium]